ncbi:MAG: hypothetical protein KatS3mg102_0556 [Planctomycetota bacterium]|nr:MAG: hypothetical protein KatS3mg102_0556 [Planctomycetota bacterium]
MTEPPAQLGAPPRARPRSRQRAWTWLVAAGSCLLGALLVFPWDHVLSEMLRLSDAEPEALSDLLDLIRPFGKADCLLVLALVAGGLGRRLRASRALLALLAVGLLVLPVKLLVDRPRPAKGDQSMPSGDTAAAAAVWFALAGASPAARLGALAVSSAVGYSRLARGWHYPSDVLVGLAMGLLAAALAERWVRRPWLRLRRRWWAALAVLAWALLWLLLPHRAQQPLALATTLFGPAAALAVATAVLVRPWARRRQAARSWLLASGVRAPWPVVLLGLGVLVWLSGASTLWDRDEPRFARAAVEMVRSGDYLVPTFNGELRADKPILIYWLMSLAVRAFGVHEMAVRAAAPLGMAAAALATFGLGRRLCSTPVGWLAAVVLLLTPLTLVTGSAATTDAVLLAWITSSLWWYARCAEQGWSWARTAVLAVLFGGALLTKGPVGLAVPLLAVATAGWLGRPSPWPAGRGWGRVAAAALGGTALFAAWAIPANQGTAGRFAAEGIGHHVVGRALSPLEGHGGPFLLSLPFYLVVIPLGFLPWTLYLPAALRLLYQGRVGERRGRALLGGWLVSTFVLMSLVATKLPHYIQPVWPALAIAVAATAVHGLGGELRPDDRRWLRYGRILVVAILVPLGLGLVLAPWWFAVGALRLPCVAAGVLLLVWTAHAVREQRAHRHLGALGVLVLGMLLLVALISGWVLPAAESFKVSRPIAEAIRARAAPEVPVVMYKYTESSLVFYLDRPQPVARLSDRELAAWLAQEGAGVLVASRAGLERFVAQHGHAARIAALERIAERSGYNYAKGRWVEVLALGRDLPPPGESPR